MKKIKLFEEFADSVNEKKFNAGETWEWHTVEWDPKRKNNFKVVKKVEITDIESNGDVIGRIVGTPDKFIVRDASKYLKKQIKESVESTEEMNEGVVSIKGGRIIAHKVLNKLVDMGLIPVKKKSDDLLETIAEVIANAKMESVETEGVELNEAVEVRVSLRHAKEAIGLFNDMYRDYGTMKNTDVFSFKNKDAAHDFVQGLVKHLHIPVGEIDAPKNLLN